jgi:hypothetical protein
MNAERLRPTDSLLVRRDKHGQPYTERACEHCGNLTWLRAGFRFCSRSCAGRGRSGQLSYNWAGDDASYRARHGRVYAARGKADRCSLRPGLSACTSEDYEWAQIPGTHGLDVREYAALCVPCHRALDLTGVPRPAAQGNRHPMAKLNKAIVLECRKRDADGESRRALAREFKVSHEAMRKAITGITWAHL